MVETWERDEDKELDVIMQRDLKMEQAMYKSIALI
jgi:hypothetical protein